MLEVLEQLAPGPRGDQARTEAAQRLAARLDREEEERRQREEAERRQREEEETRDGGGGGGGGGAEADEGRSRCFERQPQGLALRRPPHH